MYLDKDIENEIMKYEYLGDTKLNEALEELKCALALFPKEPNEIAWATLSGVYDKAFRALYRFYDYWASLYGTGLEIAGYHLNGNLEPFDNFFESAMEYAEMGIKIYFYQKMMLRMMSKLQKKKRTKNTIKFTNGSEITTIPTQDEPIRSRQKGVKL